MFYERAHLRCALGQRISALVEQVGMEVIVYQSEQRAEAVRHRGRIRKLGVRDTLLKIVRNGILDVGAESDQLYRTVPVAGERGRKRGSVVVDKARVEAGGNGVLAFDPGHGIGGIKRRQ